MTSPGDPIAVLLDLLHRSRDAATLEELGFVIVNLSVQLTPYRQAALWLEGRGLAALSGLPAVESTTPFGQWLGRVCAALAPAMAQAGAVDPALVPPADRDEWAEWLPPFAAWLPLSAPGGRRLGGLLLARDAPWSAVEFALLGELAHAYGHALALFLRDRGLGLWVRLRRHRFAIGLALVALMAMPVPLTVLAPAEMVAAHPAVIRAPLDGVIDRIHVVPNQPVAEGAALFDLDPTQLDGKLDVATKALATAEAEYRLASQQAVFDPAAKSRLAVLSGRMEERAAEAEHLRTLRDRIQVKAPRAGLALLDDPTEWIGRPVAVGERVMTLADERDTEIEAWLAVGDAIDLVPGMTVTMFLNADPLHPVEARLRFVGYEALPRPDGTVAYRVRADLAPAAGHPRLGLKGTARIAAGHAPALYWILRRPLAAVRHVVGL